MKTSEITFAKDIGLPATKPILVLDMRNALELPKNFRTTSDDLSKKTQINTEGLSKLYIAGGGQFSKLGLEKILNKLHTKHLTIVDLRQESHGFLNGNAVSWYGPSNATNAEKSSQEILEIQEQLLNELGKEQNAIVYEILEKTSDMKIADTRPLEFAVHRTAAENEIAEKFQLGYRRLFVQDYLAPSDLEVDRFIQIVKELPLDQWIYFHCRAGVGRTTTFMTLYDMMYNAKKVSFEDILARQKALGGKDLIKLPRPSQYKYLSSQKRLTFLKQFYQYAHDNHDNFETTWSNWNKK
jgi:protein tyrosine phosphatase